MLDMHCHILPGVDDGAQNMAEAARMMATAKAVGISDIVCTPHVREPYFTGKESFERMWKMFYALEELAPRVGVKLRMGFEVNYHKLMELGLDWAEVLCIDGSKNLLLELATRASKSQYVEYERTIFELQGRGYNIIIAHPERYQAIQEDIELAENLVRMGCRLQASADFIEGGRLGHAKKPAQKMFKRNLYSFIASDAHMPSHYYLFEDAHRDFGSYLI